MISKFTVEVNACGGLVPLLGWERIGGSIMMGAKRPKWMEKREMQGHSYDEVVAEIDRRAAGEYIFSAAEAKGIRARGIAEVGVMFRFSALLHDFLKKEGLTLEEFFAVYHDDDREHLVFLARCADPVSLGTEMSCDTEIDNYYPGAHVQRD